MTALSPSLRVLPLVLVVACGGSAPPATSTPPPAPPPSSATPPSLPTLASHAVALPGANGVVLMDYMAADRAAGRAWVPAAGLGIVALVDGASYAAQTVGGFTTTEADIRGHKYMVGPSAVAIGDGTVFIGNRGDGTICAVDPAAMKTGTCYPLAHGNDLAESADGIAYVASTKELWVTVGAPPIGIAPQPDASVVVLDASNPQKLTKTGRVKLGGSAEGYAVDEGRGVFYTNREEANETVAIDVKTKQVTATWKPGCDNEGPRGLADDAARGFLVVACTSGVVVLDAGHDGAVLAKADTGGGVDNIDYDAAKKQLFVASAEHGSLTVFGVDDHGALTKLATGKTAKGARVVVADDAGRAYVADPANGRVLVFDPVK